MATGTMGACASMAMMKPPFLNGSRCPLRLRVPSGKIRNELPARIDSAPRRIEVAFARPGRSADELLVEKVRRESDLGGVVVVSDDCAVVDRCGFLGARTMATAEFGRMLKPAPAAGSSRDRKLSPGEVKEWMEWLGLDASGERKERRK